MIFSLNFGSFIPRTCMMDVKYPSRSGGICRGEMKMMLRCGSRKSHSLASWLNCRVKKCSEVSLCSWLSDRLGTWMTMRLVCV